MQVKTLKVLDSANLPVRMNFLSPFIVYTMVDYWNLPIWVFATYMTLWVIVFILGVILNFSREKVTLK